MVIKAPGPDGFSAAFYQAFWDIVQEDVCKEVRLFFERGTFHQRYNETHVRLIPKVKVPKTVADYRPIALCSTNYKIIAKILCSRLRPLLPSIISPSQSAFVADRAISDNVLITHEVLHYLRNSKAKKHCTMAIKTDMSKAYDRIEWDFLEAVLLRFGFHPIWTGWIMECVRTVSYSFLINGGAKGCVIPSRELRQGDPLSPYLFILCSEVLSGLCLQAQENGSLPGVNVARDSPALNHLLFTDDTMFFCKSDPDSCLSLASILQRYEDASGQYINRQKSAITFSAKTPLGTRVRVKDFLQIESEGGVGKYLGLPEHFTRRKRDIFASLVDKLRQREHSWSTRFLNGAGKQVLLKAVLAALPAYAMTCFKLPVSLCKQIQSILTRFWWDVKPNLRKMAWVSWDHLTKPKSAGGLGFREIGVFNDALLAKMAWRILKTPQSLLARVLLGKYCHSEDFLTVGAAKTISHGWRGILAGHEVLRQRLSWVVGSGKDIRVWDDPWLSLSLPLRPMGPPTLENQNLRVSDLMLQDSHDWNLDAIRLHLPQYEDHIRMLVPSSLNMHDELVWLASKTGTYSSKSGYAITKVNTEPLDQIFSWKAWIWNIKTSPKLKHLLWKIKNRAIPVGLNLEARGLTGNFVCKRCGQPESELHLFMHCPFASKVWELAPVMHAPRPENIASLNDLFRITSKLITLPPIGLNEAALYPWILWYLWSARNKLIFEDLAISEQEVVTLAIKEAISWQAAQQGKSATNSKPSFSKLPLLPHLLNQTQCYVDAA